MSKDRRFTAGRYGAKGRQLTRDDFAGIVFTLLPTDESESSAEPTASPAGGAVPSVPAEVIDSARRHCTALARAWPQEPIATLADLVADLLGARSAPSAGVLYAAALLCGEEAARLGAAAPEALPEALDSPWSVSIRLKSAVLEAGSADGIAATAAIARSVESAFDD